MSGSRPIKIGICVPTIRAAQAAEFLARWGPIWRQDQRHEVVVFLHEDHPRREFALDASEDLHLVHSCQLDIAERMGGRAWIIPRGSGACRSFPMYLAWQGGCEFIITLDDDCLPRNGSGADFIACHLQAFRRDRWFRTIDGVEARGVPYGDKGSLPVLLNHGLWDGVPDLDGATALQQQRAAVQVTVRAAREVVPRGMFFALCGMNVCYHRSAIPAAYNLLMGLEQYGFDRFDDIWSGLFLKRIADHLGLFITSGVPLIEHVKASDPYVNLQREACGIRLHEYFWRYVAQIDLDGCRDIAGCYLRLAEQVALFPQSFPEARAPGGYFEQLSEAMRVWLTLFDASAALGAEL